MKEFTMYEQNEIISKQKLLNARWWSEGRNACEICSWLHIYNSRMGPWNFDQFFARQKYKRFETKEI